MTAKKTPKKTTKIISAKIDSTIARQLKIVAAVKQCSNKDLLEEAINDLTKKYKRLFKV